MENREEILTLLEKNAKLSAGEIAVMLGLDAAFVASEIDMLEKSKTILAYNAIINWGKDQTRPGHGPYRSARDAAARPGFDRIASRIYRYPQVKSCYLMSGGFDLMIIIEDDNLKDVAMFVSEKIAPLDNVISTRTHFILKKYKMNGTEFAIKDDDDREAVVL